MTIHSSYQQALNIVCSVFDAYSSVLFLPGDSEEQCRLAASFSLGDQVAPEAAIEAGKGLVGWILRNRQPLLVLNFDQHQSHLGYYCNNEEAHIKAFMGCPLRTGGALCVDSKRQYSFSDKDHKILQMFAEMIARQQDNAGRELLAGDIPRYFAQLGILQDLRFRHKRWSDFLQSFLRGVADATGFDYCAFASTNSSGASYVIEGESARVLLDGRDHLTIPSTSGIAGWVFRNDQPVFEGSINSSSASLFGNVPDMPAFQAVICLPVIVNKATRGVLCLAHTEARDVDETMRSFLLQAVGHLSLYLESLYLKNRLRNMMPQAQVHNRRPASFDPDAAPLHSDGED